MELVGSGCSRGCDGDFREQLRMTGQEAVQIVNWRIFQAKYNIEMGF